MFLHSPDFAIAVALALMTRPPRQRPEILCALLQVGAGRKIASFAFHFAFHFVCPVDNLTNKRQIIFP